jgi:hypothetical protein
MTVFQCLEIYCRDRKIPLLNKEHRNEIGRMVINTWYHRQVRCTLNRATIKEPEGSITVISYPKFFKDEINKCIHRFFNLPKIANPFGTPFNSSATPIDTPSKGIDTLPTPIDTPSKGIDTLPIPLKKKRQRIPYSKPGKMSHNKP